MLSLRRLRSSWVNKTQWHEMTWEKRPNEMKQYAVCVQDKEGDIQRMERLSQTTEIRKNFLEKGEKISWFFFRFVFICSVVVKNVLLLVTTENMRSQSKELEICKACLVTLRPTGLNRPQRVLNAGPGHVDTARVVTTSGTWRGQILAMGSGVES